MRHTTATLLLLVALNAFGGGLYGMLGASDIPREWIENTIFPDYFLPSAFLFVVIGCTSFFSAFLLFKNLPFASRSALYTGILLLLWMIIQIALIGYVSFLQPVIGVTAVLIIFLSFHLHKQQV